MALAPATKIIANLGLSSKSLSGSGPSSAGFISKYLNRGDIFGQDSIYYDKILSLFPKNKLVFNNKGQLTHIDDSVLVNKNKIQDLIKKTDSKQLDPEIDLISSYADQGFTAKEITRLVGKEASRVPQITGKIKLLGKDDLVSREKKLFEKLTGKQYGDDREGLTPEQLKRVFEEFDFSIPFEGQMGLNANGSRMARVLNDALENSVANRNFAKSLGYNIKSQKELMKEAGYKSFNFNDRKDFTRLNVLQRQADETGLPTVYEPRGKGAALILPSNKRIANQIKKEIRDTRLASLKEKRGQALKEIGEAYKNSMGKLAAKYGAKRDGFTRAAANLIKSDDYFKKLNQTLTQKYISPTPPSTVAHQKAREQFEKEWKRQMRLLGKDGAISDWRLVDQLKRSMNRKLKLKGVEKDLFLELDHHKLLLSRYNKSGVPDWNIGNVGYMSPLSHSAHLKKAVMESHTEGLRILLKQGKTKEAKALVKEFKETIKKHNSNPNNTPIYYDYTGMEGFPKFAQIKNIGKPLNPYKALQKIADRHGLKDFQLPKELTGRTGKSFLEGAPLTSEQVKILQANPTVMAAKRGLAGGGRVGMDGGGKTIDPEDIKKEMERALKEDGETLSEKEAIDNIVQLRLGFDEGGRVGMQIGGATPKSTGTLGGGGGTGTIGGGPTNKVGTIQSILAGIGAGIIDIPRGAFTLGAALMDLGLGTNKAAKVEQWFDDLTEFDETAEQSTLASLVRTLTNLGIPGAAAWKMGTQVTKKALLAKRNGNYFRITDPKLEERMKTALNAKGRIAATLGGAAGAGVSDAIFVGDPETVGTMGDMFGGGPTELTPNDSTEASREVMNRIKFGIDGALFLGVIGGTGSSIKSAIARRNDLSSTNSTLDKFLSKLRPRGAKPQEFFDLERRNIGLRAGDVNYASEVARKLDKHIDAIFPFVKNPFDKMGNKGRAEFMDELNETLLSGRIEMDVTGKSAFGEMDPERVRKIIKMMRDRGAKQKDIDGVLDSFEQMRLGWAHMFSRLGYSMADADPKVLEEFKGIIGDKFKSYLGSTYEIFQNKSLIPLLNYAPTEEAVNKAVKLVQDSARTAGKTINDEEARHFVDKMVESARLPRGLATSKEKTSGIYLEVPDFFANKTVLSDLEFNPKISLDSLTPDARKVIDEVLGKVKDPMQTMLAGSGRLSLITRRNQFYEELMKKSADDIAEGKKGFFYETELDAFNALGGNIKKIEIDPTRTIEAGITNPLNGKYAERGVAEAIEESAMLARDKGTVRQMYDSLILYPKATSQIAKTILSPITHVRNFVSAGAFAGANGLIPGLVSPTDMAAAMKDAYKALQIPGARMANDAYRELLRLGVVNSNVRLGDLQRLLQDVNFGETLTAQKGLRGLMRPLSKAKKWTEEMYTAEDDFWKITSYALERQRLSRAYQKYGIKVNDELLNEEAASIVRNNIPNYDMVNDFIKGLRQLPFGNFVSFPAEIMRTSTNILGRALKEINYQHTLDDGRVVNPLRDIGYKRLFGFGTTVVAVPYGTVEAAKAIYNVTEDEMKAMRRFVPGWSQNSTLVPIRDTETGELKYVDFSHANAYDTMIRPINTMINSVGKGIDEGEIMKNIALGMFDATKETVSPFISESIWFEGASDIFLRGGRTREGRRLWTEATPWGEKVSLTVGHLVKTQMPGSIPALNRMGLAIREEVDEYGRTYEFGDELAGIFGFRAVKVDPIRSMKFKIADFRTGINAARREFTAPLLRGGVVDPADVVDRFEIANEAAYKVQQDMFKDYYGARTLGVNTAQLDLQFADRVSGTQLNAIKAGKFKPFIPSDNIKKAFADNARAIGAPNGYLAAERQIQSMIRQYNNLPLFGDLLFPKIENPFIGNTTLPNAAVQGIQPVAAVSGMQGGITAGGINNPNLTAIKGQQVFGSTDPIFGVG